MNQPPEPANGNKKRTDTPPELVPPDAKHHRQETDSRRKLLLIAACGVLLFVTAVAVLFMPPRSPESIPDQPKQSPPPANHLTKAAPEGAETDESATEVNRLLVDWLKQQAAAEADNISAWGGDSYARAVALASQCDQLLGERSYLPAREACQEASGLLKEILASKGELLQGALTAGELTLAEGAPEEATGQFQRALAMDPGNPRATEGLRRAANLPDVLRLVETGLKLEQDGDLEAAKEAFSQAARRDPDFLPARESLSRVEAAVADQQFQQAMSRAIQALSRGELARTDKALKQAQALKPNDQALGDLKEQLFRSRLKRNLGRLRQQSEKLEKSERWSEALKVCEQALALDPNAAFAASCRQRMKPRIMLEQKITSILSNPERLYADGPLAQAREVLASASQTSPRGPLLAGQIEQLSQLIEQAETEVKVVISSDGLTEVVIYHVGRLGRFTEKQLTLRTGNYTVTGSRNGFRDVRQVLKVRPGQGRMTFTLRCEEPI